MEVYMDDKCWKLSKKGSRRSLAARAAGEEEGVPVGLQMRPVGLKPGVSARLASLVKEQRARFYITRRCLTMLLCWRDYH